MFEDRSNRLGGAVLLRSELTNLVVADSEVGLNPCDISFTLRVELHSFAHDQEALKAPLVEYIAAVVTNESVFAQVHNIPSLVIGKSVVGGIVGYMTGLAAILACHTDARPDLSAVGCEHVEQSGVVDFAVSDFKFLNLAVEAVIDWIKALHDIPRAVEEVTIDSSNGLSWVAASSIVDRSGRREGEALVVHE